MAVSRLGRDGCLTALLLAGVALLCWCSPPPEFAPGETPAGSLRRTDGGSR